MHCRDGDPVALSTPECRTCLFCHGRFHLRKPGRVASAVHLLSARPSRRIGASDRRRRRPLSAL